jgi:hypothetical protein
LPIQPNSTVPVPLFASFLQRDLGNNAQIQHKSPQ